MYDTVPSPECPSGRGRIAVYEMFKIDREVQAMILKIQFMMILYKIARKNGMLTMKRRRIRCLKD